MAFHRTTWRQHAGLVVLPSRVMPVGQHFLGLMYRDGKGVAQDDAEAVRWFRRAAEQGYARAQQDLASAYYFGRGVPGLCPCLHVV